MEAKQQRVGKKQRTGYWEDRLNTNVLWSTSFVSFYVYYYLVCLFVLVCITIRIILANEQTILQAAYLSCAKLALCFGASSRVTICRQGGMLKDAAMGFVSVQTICFELWVDLYGAWTQLYMFWVGS